MTPEQVHELVQELRAEVQKQIGDLKIWIAQLLTIGAILIGVGLLILILFKV